jgi:hypothetical protein
VAVPAAVRLAEQAPTPTAVIAATTTWEQFPTLWPALLAEVWQAIRAGGARAGRNIMLYRDQRPAVEVGVELEGPFTAAGRVTASSLPAGPTATTIAPGPPTVDGIRDAHHRVIEWCDAHGDERTGVLWEIYSHQTADPSASYTEIHHALEPAPRNTPPRPPA